MKLWENDFGLYYDVILPLHDVIWQNYGNVRVQRSELRPAGHLLVEK